MEMDEMELDRYINGMLDRDHRDLKRDVSAGKGKHKRKQKGEEQDHDSGKRVVETNG